mgnify:CR=1 FL=1|jgi:glycosyltransferase involved in cell wall biosynthesis
MSGRRTKRCSASPVDNLILTSDLTGGGAESVTYIMADHLSRGHCVAFSNKNKTRLRNCSLLVMPNILPKSRIFVTLRNLLRLVIVQWQKIRYLPATTISHLEGPNFLNILTWGGGRRLLFVHNSPTRNYDNTNLSNVLKKYLIQCLYKRASVIVGVSTEICRELIVDYGVDSKKVVFVPNPIDVEKITNLSREPYGDWRDEFLSREYIICVASLTPQKNHSLLIDAFSILKKKFPGLKLVLVGIGQNEATLVEQCSNLKLEVVSNAEAIDGRYGDVYMVGFQSNPYPLIANSRALILTSLWEGLPIILLEALALRVVPVVSNCSSGIRYIMFGTQDCDLEEQRNQGLIESKFGLVVDSRNDGPEQVEIWAGAIEYALLGSSKRQSWIRESQKRIQEFDIKNIVEIWRKLGLEIS